jgi:hypothetical protein
MQAHTHRPQAPLQYASSDYALPRVMRNYIALARKVNAAMRHLAK